MTERTHGTMESICLPFNFQKRLTCNFSLQYSYTNQQTGNEITKTYQLEVIIRIYNTEFLSLNCKEMCNS